MHRLPLIVAFMTGCGTLPHVEPQVRPPAAQAATVVVVESTCPSPYETIKDGTGVVISDNSVLTAAHVVRCADIPHVELWTATGGHFWMDVVRDDAMFGDGTDVARLRTIGAYDRFGIKVPPPTLGVPGYDDTVCAQPYGRKPTCGDIEAQNTFRAETHPGDSGSPVYDDGKLIGLVVAGGDGYTEYVPVDSTWLQGT